MSRQNPSVLVLYYSFSGQTAGLLNRLAGGLEQQGVRVTLERLHTKSTLRFPIGTIIGTVRMMLTTFFRQRVEIDPLPEICFVDYDLIILAGPTWSYNPSGPVLSLLSGKDSRLFAGRQVLPLISCRGYWRMHWLGLRRLLRKRGAVVENKIVFSHPNKEPWRTIGVFLKLAGRSPERSPFWGRYYKRYGHSRDQLDEAQRIGRMIGEAIKQGRPLASLDFATPLALP